MGTIEGTESERQLSVDVLLELKPKKRPEKVEKTSFWSRWKFSGMMGNTPEDCCWLEMGR